MLTDNATLLKVFIAKILLRIQIWILKILDFITSTFRVLAGLEPISGDKQSQDLVKHFIFDRNVSKVFWGIVLIATVLLFLFLIIRIIKDTAKDDLNKQSRGQLVKHALLSFVLFLLIPFMLMALVVLSNTIVGAIYKLMLNTETVGEIKFGGELFLISSEGAYIGDPAFREEIEKMFLRGELSYTNIVDIYAYYSPLHMNYFASILGGGIILITLTVGSILFVRRIFDVILLYMMSPFVVATRVVDDGSRMHVLKEIMISKVISAHAIVISLNVFFMLMHEIVKMDFYSATAKNGFIKMLFLIGGAVAAVHAHYMISGIITQGQSNLGMNEIIHSIRATTAGTIGVISHTVGAVKVVKKVTDKVAEKIPTIKEKARKIKNEIHTIYNKGKT